jgi:DUF971 family protein
VPRLCEFYPGICLTTEGKARKNLSQGKKNLSLVKKKPQSEYSIHITKTPTQDATLHSLFYLDTALNVSGGTTTHHEERKQLYLQHLVFVTLLLLRAAIAVDCS